MEIAVMLPTYNERENLELLVDALFDLSMPIHVVVVDDHSPDGTGEIASRLAAERPGCLTAIHRQGKLGLGTAHLTGFRAAIARRSDLILSMDADFSHHPRYVPAMAAKIDEGYDLVIGSRYVHGGAVWGSVFLPPTVEQGGQCTCPHGAGVKGL